MKDRVVLVTGAGGGVGRATAIELCRRGAALGITDLDDKELAITEQKVLEAGGACLRIAGDITLESTARSLVDQVAAQYGSINGICNAAGTLAGGAIEDISRQNFQRTMDVNCYAQFQLIQLSLPFLKKSELASIVNVASVGALVALPQMVAYCASKAAVTGLTKAVAAELGPNIRCNAVCPGGIKSKMSDEFLSKFPPNEREAIYSQLIGRQLIKRMADPHEIAQVICFLLSDESSYMTGAIVAADGGHSCW